MYYRLNIHKRLAFVLWGVALQAFVVTGGALLLYQNLTIKRRIQELVDPYVHLVSVGTDVAVAFEDPLRTQEILDTLQANPRILAASIHLDNGRVLASYGVNSEYQELGEAAKADGIYLNQGRAEILQSLPTGARLQLVIELDHLLAQSHQTLWIFGIGTLILLAVTLAQMAVLRRTLVRPLAELTGATELVQKLNEYEYRVPATGTDEIARLGQNFNAMMDVIQEREDRLRRLNRELHAISECNQILVRAEDEQSLLNDICRIICQEAGYHLAWVGYADNDNDKTLRPVAWYGAASDFLEKVSFSRDPDAQGDCGPGSAVREGKIKNINDLTINPDLTPWSKLALLFGLQSCISLPLKNEHAVFGVLSIYSAETHVFTEEEERLLEELAVDLAFGIITLRTRIEHNKAEEQIRIAATAFEAQEGIIITDDKQNILRVNCAFSEITGYSAEEAVGANPRMLKSRRHNKAFYQAMWTSIHRDDAWQGEVWNRRKNGEIYLVWLNITVVKKPDGNITHYVGTMIDITENKAAAAKIEHLAFHDSLTKLPNRRLLLNRLEQALTTSTRTQHQGALLFIDLDNFKILNDTLGHQAGDQLLVEVAKRLTSCVRREDTIARFGGDEFMVMLTGLGQQTEDAANKSKQVGEKILSSLNQTYNIGGHVHHITPSIGITLFIDTNSSPDDLMKQADIAMYQAKSEGRNTLRFFDPEMQAALTDRAALEKALRKGIEKEQFILHYQPQVDNTNGIIGAEVLLRWNHAEWGMVSPADFIPLAEETGLIVPIGQWVLESVCQQLRTWMDHPDTRKLQLAVNVSPRQFSRQDFVQLVQQVLEKTGVPATRLKLELTESLLIDNIENSIRKMLALKELGVGFSLDDFGTGYSSLSYLTQLPLDQLKIDQSFIYNLPDNHNDAVVVQTIITMARSLKLTVIAEGVETEAQKQFLEQHGCTTYQGYLFSKPVDIKDYESLFLDNRKLDD